MLNIVCNNLEQEILNRIKSLESLDTQDGRITSFGRLNYAASCLQQFCELGSNFCCTNCLALDRGFYTNKGLQLHLTSQVYKRQWKQSCNSKIGLEEKHWNDFNQYNKYFCRRKKTVQDAVELARYSSLHQNRNCFFNAQGNASRITPGINVFLLQNELATYKMQRRIPVI